MVDMNNVVVLDNGAHMAKVGFATNDDPSYCMPNCIMKAKSERRRAFVGDQIDECRDLSELYYLLPFQKGYLVNFETQKRVWDFIFGRDRLNVDFQQSGILITEPVLNFPSVAGVMNEIMFEEYEYRSVLRLPAPDLVAQSMEDRTFLIVDSGYSFTHILPYVHGQRISKGVRRVDVGGKILTNHLKEVISYRQVNVLDETYVMNHAKEDACYVSLDFVGDITKASAEGRKSEIYRDYVLPNFMDEDHRRGFLRSREKSTGISTDKTEQLISLCLERISIPEILFHPSYLPGHHQKGICEALVESVRLCPPEFHPNLLKEVHLIGGCTLFPNFAERVRKDLREMLPDTVNTEVKEYPNVLTLPWRCGRDLARNEVKFQDFSVTREEYQEWGNDRVNEHFLENVLWKTSEDDEGEASTGGTQNKNSNTDSGDESM
ncbi:unnamed protein product [Cyprideis torosa]|uniref:Actin-related protein 6 n=1 Tax=Cyprideis torosa TaxID=163714 RepID=A0A7R8WD86_9CRUS|nr:unnamed protein product [Cyprideis torosa]CAG0889158.1 unnamed protein product [Cyprideis torosa]